jgi:hypothetical protein
MSIVSSFSSLYQEIQWGRSFLRPYRFFGNFFALFGRKDYLRCAKLPYANYFWQIIKKLGSAIDFFANRFYYFDISI